MLHPSPATIKSISRYKQSNKSLNMLPPIKIPVPSGTNAIYLTALSLYDKPSTVSVSWTDGSATFGADFVGPSETYVLGDKIFGQPIIAAVPVPSEVSVSFNFEDTMTSQHSVSEPITKKVGPEGIATSVQISGYAAADHHHHKPTTITMVFQGSLGGLSAQS
ncbi:hypothetical protein NA56DRAFT_647198 [Hyaloscypha hepaticicola]|uniref:Uncharacterized protein n=1 Tax=Hyaloscypha hepaticicola TaxID=2082293 RepID=A0A2J6PZP4_9HELO|nr:hypothetical protein NA56DRAFT_647198 [Hyaloscypha hepaticicola]